MGSYNQTITTGDPGIDRYEKRLLFSSGGKLELDEIVNKTICGNSLELVLNMPHEFVDLLILDPPYNLNKKFNSFEFSKMSSHTYGEYIDNIIAGLFRTLKKNATIYMCGDWYNCHLLHKYAEKYFTVINRITWQRDKGRGRRNNYKNCMEDIWFCVMNKKDYYFDIDSVKLKRRVNATFAKSPEYSKWIEENGVKYRMTHPSNIWDDITIPFWSMPENTEHPTQKPEKLLARLILASCPPDGMVFDPFLGSGTTSVVAKKLDRKYCGIEIDKGYAMIAEKRIDIATSDKSIQGYFDGIFWERNSYVIQRNRERKNSRKSESNPDNEYID